MSRPPDPRPDGASPPARPGPSDLVERIQAALVRDARIDHARVEVLLSDGVIALEGTVASLEQREAAEAVARRAPGVEEVRNDLVVDGVIRVTF